jgi:hypothetical protein
MAVDGTFQTLRPCPHMSEKGLCRVKASADGSIPSWRAVTGLPGLWIGDFSFSEAQ